MDQIGEESTNVGDFSRRSSISGQNTSRVRISNFSNENSVYHHESFENI